MADHLLQHPLTPSSMSPPVADRQPPTPVSASGCTRFSSQSYLSSITLDHTSRDLSSSHFDAVQTHWTNEKHRSYIGSLEASFVQELQQLKCLYTLSSKQKMRRKPIVPNVSSSEARQYIHSKSGINIQLQDASWQKANIGGNDPSLDRTADSPAILEDLLLNSFPSGGKQCTLVTLDLLEDFGSCSDRRHLRKRINSCGSARRSQQIPLRCRDSYTIATEVSDQNFLDNHPGELSGGMPIAKRLKKATSDSSGQ